MAAGDLQHVSAAVCAVPAEHGLHPGAGPATVARTQVCVPQEITLTKRSIHAGKIRFMS